MAITAEMVKALREATGMGMMECKKALVECAGDMQQAKDLLRIKSGAKADKVAGRQASEGRVAFAAQGGAAALVEISCETDFVARDDNMVAFAEAVAAAAAGATDAVDATAADGLTLADGTTVADARKQMVMKLGENIGVRRVATLNAADADGVVCYIHNGDKIGAAAVYQGDEATARDVCMHIAAMRPRYVERDNIPAAVLEKEKEIYAAQAAESGKPENIAAKMAEGKLKKFIEEITLLPQPFAKDPEKKVGEVLAAAKTNILSFALLCVGEE